MTSPRPLRRDAEANLQRILDAAHHVLTERGLDFGMEDIARQAGCGVGTVYRRFPNKQALLEHQFRAMKAEMAEQVRAAAADPDPVAGLGHLLAGLGQRMAKDHGLRDLLVGVPGLREEALAARRALRPVITTLLERAQAAGAVREDVEAADLTMIVAMLAEVISITSRVDATMWRRYLALLLDGLRPGSLTPLPGRAPGPRQLTRMVSEPATRRVAGPARSGVTP